MPDNPGVSRYSDIYHHITTELNSNDADATELLVYFPSQHIAMAHGLSVLDAIMNRQNADFLEIRYHVLVHYTKTSPTIIYFINIQYVRLLLCASSNLLTNRWAEDNLTTA